MFLEMQNGLAQLKSTQEKLHQLTQPNRELTLSQVNNVAKSLGLEIKDKQLKDKQSIADRLAEQVIAKVAKKSPSAVSLVQIDQGT